MRSVLVASLNHFSLLSVRFRCSNLIKSSVFREVDDLILCVFLWVGVMPLGRMVVLMSGDL